MRYRRTRPGEPTHLFLPEEYVQSHPDENQLDDANPDRPLFWQSGEGTIDRPTLIIANATDIKWRIGADELRDMALEMAQNARTDGSRDRAMAERMAWQEALIRGLERAKSVDSKRLLRRLKFG